MVSLVYLVQLLLSVIRIMIQTRENNFTVLMRLISSICSIYGLETEGVSGCQGNSSWYNYLWVLD